MNNQQETISMSPSAVAARVVDEAYRSLVTEAQYPTLPHELTAEFLAGVDPRALTPQEKAALAQEYEADLRLTGLLDKLFTALSSRQAKLLVKDKALHELIGPKDGLRSFADFRGQQSGRGARVAAQELEVAQTLVETPSAQRAVDAGEITIDHVEVLSKAVSRLSRRGDDNLTATEQAELVEMGKGRTADDYAKAASRYLNGRNPLAHDASHSQIRRKRFLQVSYTPVGAHLRGFIDPVAAQSLRLALEAATPKPSKDDDRSYEQRSADALEAVATLALNTGDLKAGALVRPHLSFVMTEKTFRDATRELARREQFATHQRRTPTSGGVGTPADQEHAINPGGTNENQTATRSGSEVSCGHAYIEAEMEISAPALPTDRMSSAASPTSSTSSATTTTPTATATRSGASGEATLDSPTAMEPAEFEDGTTIPLTELTRLICDSQITRVVLNADGTPLNLGRTQRLYAKELRRAIIVRDKSCRFAGCTMAARWSEIHHIQWWEKDNGETSIENGILCCKFHHSQIHERVLKVVHDEFGLPQIVRNTVGETEHHLDSGQHSPPSPPPARTAITKEFLGTHHDSRVHASAGDSKEPSGPALFRVQGKGAGDAKPGASGAERHPEREWASGIVPGTAKELRSVKEFEPELELWDNSEPNSSETRTNPLAKPA